MGILIGTDEAGYGPNLGPLVISTTVWESGADPEETDPWALFSPVITSEFKRGETRLHAGDSKAVYTPAKGIKQLERSVLSLLGVLGEIPRSFQELYSMVCDASPAEPSRTGGQLTLDFSEEPQSTQTSELLTEPWFAEQDLELPLKNELKDIEQQVTNWKACCDEVQLFPRNVRSDLVLTARFNQLTRQHQSKGVTLSQSTMGLLQSVWNPAGREPCLIVLDKHGGRNQYLDLIKMIAGGENIKTLEEGNSRSCYQVRQTELRFQTKAEAFFPVAWASMVSKYLREISMELFNRFWQTHLPDLKATKGYPVDAKRFRAEVEAVRQELNIPEEIFWRIR